MTRKELIKELIPKVNVDNLDCSILSCKCDSKGCKNCVYKNYWNEEVVIPKTVAKELLNSVYGVSKYYDTDSEYFVFSSRTNGKTYAQHLELIREGWTQLPPIHNNIDWTTLNEIMCDAIVNGFEVKILNGTIYYREKQ